jgi:hypothetical protein
MRFISQPLDDRITAQQQAWNTRTKSICVPKPAAILDDCTAFYDEKKQSIRPREVIQVDSPKTRLKYPMWGISITLKLISRSSVTST